MSNQEREAFEAWCKSIGYCVLKDDDGRYKSGYGLELISPFQAGAAYQREQDNSKCKCSMAIRMLGEGCRYCQPQNYIDHLSETIDELRTEANEQVKGLVEALEQLARLGNGDRYGNSDGNLVAIEALATYRSAQGDRNE